MRAPERFPSLAHGEVHVWAAPLALAADADEAELAILSEHERERAARFVRPRDRERYVAAHAVLRRVLGGYLASDPAAVPIVFPARGKPSLAGAGLRFNLSHSGAWALVAVAGEHEVGADIEVAGREVVWRDLARMVIDEREAAWLAGLPETEQRRAFLRLWVAKEAIAKAAGEGLALSLATIPVGPLATLPGASTPRAVAPAGGRRWWLAELDVAADALAAVACAHAPRAVRLFRWPPAMRVRR